MLTYHGHVESIEKLITHLKEIVGKQYYECRVEEKVRFVTEKIVCGEN